MKRKREKKIYKEREGDRERTESRGGKIEIADKELEMT